jgi:outer membrane protein OmpA-like peptidoglycan-associated protein
MMEQRITALFLTILLTAAGCTPITRSDPPTGSYAGPVVGGAAGAALAGVFNASRTYLWVGGLAGAGLGYYFTSLRFDSGSILHAGGQVFTVGQVVTIEVPSDSLFDTNTADFLPGTDPILDSMASVLARYPGNNIMISANTSGFGSAKDEQALSEERARQVAGYLWAHGVTGTNDQNVGSSKYDKKRQIYVGYGSYFPIANNIRLKSIRQNSRIQITAYPTDAQLKVEGCFSVFNNIGGTNEKHCHNARADRRAKAPNTHNAFSDDHLPDGTADLSNPGEMSEQVSAPIAPTENKDYNPSLEEEVTDTPMKDYNSIVSSAQTEELDKEAKQGGYKGEG